MHQVVGVVIERGAAAVGLPPPVARRVPPGIELGPLLERLEEFVGVPGQPARAVLRWSIEPSCGGASNRRRARTTGCGWARGRGLARRLVAQAARRVLADGAVPTYLHASANEASARVARAAGFPDLGWQVIGFFAFPHGGWFPPGS